MSQARTMSAEDCLPAALRGSAPTITRIRGGLSGATVHRVDASGRSFVLKAGAADEQLEDWERALRIQRAAADAGLAPRVVHADEHRRAVLTELVADRSFATFYRDPQTHAAALALLGRTVRRIHQLPIPDGARPVDARAFLRGLWDDLRAGGFALPDLAADAVQRALADDATAALPAGAPPPVLSHNDLNPTNLVYDGTALLVLDWAAARPADPHYDLATVAVFLRMDDADCLRLLSAYHDHAVATVPAPLVSTRRLVAALAGTMQLRLARRMNQPGATDQEALALGDFYQRLRSGAVTMGTPDGQWAFGLALLKESLATEISS